MLKFTLEDILTADSDMSGFCVQCGAERPGTEPDARKYPCDDCGKRAVYGAQELLLMGLVE
jgi:DNA-directed RNA polymerase subunit RPC12/RpoP